MKFISLALQNFLTIGRATLNLADRGLLCVQGLNEDDTSAESNGAGKSSLADGLCWALYGVTARGVSGDAVVNRTVGRDCSAQVEVADDDHLYIVTRYRKDKVGKNSLRLTMVDPAGASHDLTKGTDKLTQVEVEKILGCSYEVFRAAIYAGQESLPDLPALTDKSLKVLIEQAAGITLLESAYDIARAECSTAKTKVDNFRTLVERVTDQIRGLTEQETEARAQRANFKIASDSWIDAQNVMIAEKRKVLAFLDGEIKSHDKAAIVKKIAGVKAKIDAVAGERVEERRLVDELAKADRAQAIAHSQAVAIKKDVEKLKAALDGVTERVGSPCGECGKAYCADDLHDAKKIATDSLRVSVTRFKAAKEALTSAQEARQSVADALEAHRASMSDVSALSALSERLNESLRTVIDLERQHVAVMHEIGTLVERIDEKKAEVNPFDAVIKKCMDRLITLNAEHTKHTDGFLAANVALSLAETVVKIFSPSGARAHVLDTVTPFLNDRTAKYLGTLSDGRIEAAWTTLAKTAKGELREKFCIEVTKDRAGDTFAALSGGEKRKVRLATALALQDLVSERATKPISIFIGDEVDDALDKAGLERLMGVLEEKARERGTVLVISHNDLNCWIRNTITVVNRGGVATILEEAA